jgi:epoxyqueuosine reductase
MGRKHMDHRTSLSQRIKAKAHLLEFDLVGITTATPLAHAERYRAWVAQGFAGDMGYMTRNIDKRLSPSGVLSGVQSIVVLGLNYHTAPAQQSQGRGWISQYAWGEDYHAVLGEKLAALVAYVHDTEGPTVQARWYVDTGPILERELAWRAGLGWPGKHTNLINRHLGSWLFLGVILLDCELAYDEPATPHCGTCTRCLLACPTGAIVAPGVLDARRCISYLTIELRGSIPRHLRPLMGTHIFGCDICQAVCPWNRKAPESREAAFLPRAGYAAPELLPLLSLSEEEFRVRFRGSPIKRTKRRGLLRNVAVALGNLQDPRAIPALASALHDAESLIRGHAAWALGRIGGVAARGVLHAALATEHDPEVGDEISAALTEIEMDDTAYGVSSSEE